jgi:hypothetical protein
MWDGGVARRHPAVAYWFCGDQVGVDGGGVPNFELREGETGRVAVT